MLLNKISLELFSISLAFTRSIKPCGVGHIRCCYVSDHKRAAFHQSSASVPWHRNTRYSSTWTGSLSDGRYQDQRVFTLFCPQFTLMAHMRPSLKLLSNWLSRADEAHTRNRPMSCAQTSKCMRVFSIEVRDKTVVAWGTNASWNLWCTWPKHCICAEMSQSYSKVKALILWWLKRNGRSVELLLWGPRMSVSTFSCWHIFNKFGVWWIGSYTM